MLTFEDWLKEQPQHEGWVKNLAMTGALMGSALGGYKYANTNNNPSNIQNQSYTSPDAADYLSGVSLDEPQTKQSTGPFAAAKRNRDELRNKAKQLKSAGRKSGTFVHGELQP